MVLLPLPPEDELRRLRLQGSLDLERAPVSAKAKPMGLPLTIEESRALMAGFEKEDAFLRKIIVMAHLYQWTVAHFRPARTATGWATAVQGDGKGFPDLVLLRAPRLLFAEAKSAKGRLSPEQAAWLELLRQVPGVEVKTWRPSMWDEIETELRRTA